MQYVDPTTGAQLRLFDRHNDKDIKVAQKAIVRDKHGNDLFHRLFIDCDITAKTKDEARKEIAVLGRDLGISALFDDSRIAVSSAGPASHILVVLALYESFVDDDGYFQGDEAISDWYMTVMKAILQDGKAGIGQHLDADFAFDTPPGTAAFTPHGRVARHLSEPVTGTHALPPLPPAS